MKILAYILFAFFAFQPMMVEAKDLGEKLSGRILLQVENNGEAWYVNPVNKKKYFMGRPENAFVLMYELGIGITNENLEKIEIAEANFDGIDSDNDGLSDVFEDAIGTNVNNWDTDNDGFKDKEELFMGYNPKGAGEVSTDNDFTSKHLGKIFLQVENNGEAWYVNPVDKKRYFLGKPYDAFVVMQALGLGISNVNLNPISSDEEYIKKFNERLNGNYDDMYMKIISRKNEVVPVKDDSDHLEELAGKYSKDNNYVYYNSFVLHGADAVSFEAIDEYYAKDKDKVYVEFRELVGADPSSFQVLGFGYTLDKTNVYYKLEKITGADSSTFEYIKNYYAKDKDKVYFEGNVLNGENPATFSI